MRVLQIVHGFPQEFVAGTETYCETLSRHLLARGHECVVLAGSGQRATKSTLATEAQDGLLVTRYLRAEGQARSWRDEYDPEAEVLIRGLLSLGRPDIVHLHHWLSLTSNLVAICTEMGIPVVVTLHDVWTSCARVHRIRWDGSYCAEQRDEAPCLTCVDRGPWSDDQEIASALALRREIMGAELAMAKTILVPSEAHRKCLIELLELPQERLVVVPHGSVAKVAPQDARRRGPTFPQQPLQLGHWGYLTYAKGTHMILEAVHKLRDPSAVQVHLIGTAIDPAYEQQLRELARGIAVEFHGAYRPEDLQAFDLDLAVFASITSEAYSFALDEALLMGVPILVPNRGALPERIGEAGLTFQAGDAQDLARRLQELLEEPERLDTMRRRVRPDTLFSWEAHITMLEKIYQDAVHTDQAKPESNIPYPKLVTHFKQQVQHREAQLAKRETKLAEMEAQLAEQERAGRKLEERILQLGEKQTRLQVELTTIKASVSYRTMRLLALQLHRFCPEGTRRGQLRKFVVVGLVILAEEGMRAFLRKARKKIRQGGLARLKPSRLVGSSPPGAVADAQTTYELWIAENEPHETELAQQKSLAANLPYRPLLSIITPTYNTPPELLERTIRSVIDQTYDNWELCIVDGGSERLGLREVLESWAKKDDRIRIRFLDYNLGISGNTNEALGMAKGEFIALLDHDDLLAPFALFEVVKYLNEERNIDFVYSDRDLVTEDGSKRFDPLFKPGWSPEVLLSANYLTHLCVIRKQVADDVGGFNPETDGAQDWDFFFRVTERTQRIAHIPKILYHWRCWSNSAASGLHAKPYALAAQKRAIQEHMRRQGVPAEVNFESSGFFRVKWAQTGKTKVSIIIPTTGSMHLLQPCVKSVLDRTNYDDFEILIVHNGPTASSVSGYYQYLTQNKPVRVLYYDKPFNYSAANNFGAQHAQGNVLLFLNDDTEVISPDWLEELVRWVERPETGVVGAKLLRPDGTIQHAGVIIGLTGFAGHIFAGACEGYNGPFGSTEWYRNYLAVTGACMMIRRPLFEELGGFREDFVLCGSDVELCLRVKHKGYRIVYTPFARLKHHESATHQGQIPDGDFERSYPYYLPTLLAGDPFYNPNLSYWCTVPRLKQGDEELAHQFVERHLANQSGVLKKSRFAVSRVEVRNTWEQYRLDARALVSWLDFTTEQLEVSKTLQNFYAGELAIHSINWLIPDFHHVFYGGIHTVLRFANYFKTKKGIKNRFIVIGDMAEAEIGAAISKAFPGLSGEAVCTVRSEQELLNIEYADVSIATLWNTAYYLLKFNKTRRKLYFLQDHESLFYPAGSTSAQVEATYRFGFYGIANTITLKKIYEQEYGGMAEFFTPCVDTNLFYPLQAKKSAGDKVFRLFFYARPDHPRNGFELGAAALRKLKSRLGDRVLIYAAGADWRPEDHGLGGIVANLGLLAYEQTAALYRTCDVGLVLMFTRHPSYLPFELMASGCLVVTNYNPATTWLLKDGTNCLLSEPSAECIVEALEQGLVQSELRYRIVNTALREVHDTRSNWDAQIEKVFKFMCDPTA